MMQRREAIKNLGFLGLSIFLAPRMLVAQKINPLISGQLGRFDGLPIIMYESPLGKLHLMSYELKRTEELYNAFKTLKYGKTTIGTFDILKQVPNMEVWE